MSIVRVGSTQKYSDGWEKAFKTTKKRVNKSAKKTTASTKSASAKKKTAAKKKTRKK